MSSPATSPFSATTSSGGKLIDILLAALPACSPSFRTYTDAAGYRERQTPGRLTTAIGAYLTVLEQYLHMSSTTTASHAPEPFHGESSRFDAYGGFCRPSTCMQVEVYPEPSVHVTLTYPLTFSSQLMHDVQSNGIVGINAKSRTCTVPKEERRRSRRCVVVSPSSFKHDPRHEMPKGRRGASSQHGLYRDARGGDVPPPL